MQPSKNVLSEVVKQWGLSTQIMPVRKVENWIYVDEINRCYIRLTEPTHRSLMQVESELDWMDFLFTCGIKVARPLKSQQGKLVEEVASNSGRFCVSVFEEAAGIALKQKEDFSPVRMKRWGQLIAELHACTIDYQVPKNIDKRPDWDSESNYLRMKVLCDEKYEFYSKFNLLNNWLRKLPKDPEVYNLVHADIHHGNFFVNQSNDLTLIDFDDCHFHWFLYDLAVPIFHLSISLREQCLPSELDVLIKHMVESYAKTRKLASYHLEALDNFVLLRHFVLYFWATHNLTQPSLNDSTKEWIKMAIDYCSAHINKFDYSQLTMPFSLYQELSSSVT